MADNGARAARCRREAAGHLRYAEQPHLPKEIADALRKEAGRLLAKAAELVGPDEDAAADAADLRIGQAAQRSWPPSR